MKTTTEQTTVRLIPHDESFEVRISRYFYFDADAGRRSITGRPDPKAARSAAQAFARTVSPSTDDKRPTKTPGAVDEAIAAGLFEDDTTGTTTDQAAAIVEAWKQAQGLPLLSPEACGALAASIAGALREAYEAGREEAP
ncbi:hypothetical protein [Bradyrhizobium sp. SZCCHNR1093]|uniref:hypothetical protein n=1 Tax=Bradyrhizobium sp. SZCCHNR1093 TaxID=3057368 RepID=UPI0028EDC6F9|nr:hypothetical protein [Bradyrhizobium sp. SZCCHNR1093]